MKQVLITGGSRNTGFHMAKRFAGLGYCVHLTSRTLADAEQAAAKIAEETSGAQVYAYAADVSVPASIDRLFADIRTHTDALDVFVANAAHLGVDYDVFSTEVDMFDTIIHTNIRGTFFCAKESARLMTKHGGSIILMSSVQSLGAVEGRSVYGITKAAINYMAKTLAYDLAPYSIRVNALLAGAIHTDRWDALTPEVLAVRRANYPMQRESTMDEIVNGVLYLAGDGAKTVTGTQLLIDSGVNVSLLPYTARKEGKRKDF